MHANSGFIMNTIWSSRKNHSSVIHFGQNKPVPLRATRGTAVGCLSGELWVTQEGDQRDYIVPSGYRYCCSQDGLVVVNALNGPSTALVYWSQPEQDSDFARNQVCIDIESTQRLIQKAHTLRQQAMGRLFGRLMRIGCNTLRSVIPRIKAANAHALSKTSRQDCW